MSDQSKATARRFFEEIISQGDLEAVEELFAAGDLEHDPANEEDTRGHDGMRREVSAYRSAFPDVRFTVEDQLAEGDRVATRWTMRSTHEGELMGMAPTGNQVEVTGITIHRFAEGTMQEGWWNWDTMGLDSAVAAARDRLDRYPRRSSRKP